MSVNEDITGYWSVQPPFKAEQGEPGTLAWSRSIAEHRYRDAAVREGRDLRPYGWHLLIDAKR